MSDVDSDAIVGDERTQRYRTDGSSGERFWRAVEAVDIEDPLELPDVVFEMFAAEPRRRAVGVLWEVERPLPVAELAILVVASSQGTDVGSVTTDQRDRAAIELHHVHLPKLEEWGFIEWDRDDGAVVLLDGLR